jgi:transcriptional regulator with XRE-family HTH domain
MQPIRRLRFKNRLAEIRRHRGFDEKRVASLLGVKTDALASYEVGFRIPNLNVALKLAQIYGVPVRVMLNEYYEACRREVLQREKRFSNAEVNGSIRLDDLEQNFCTFELKLLANNVSAADISSIRRHSTVLIRKSAEELGHM